MLFIIANFSTSKFLEKYNTQRVTTQTQAIKEEERGKRKEQRERREKREERREEERRGEERKKSEEERGLKGTKGN